jgi:hypothetical protein
MNGPQFAVSDVSAVSVYQNRVWFGMSDAKGTLLASEVGYGYDDPNFPTTTQSNTKFVFGRVQNDYVGDGATNDFLFQANAGVPGTGLSLADMLRVTLAGAIQPPANYVGDSAVRRRRCSRRGECPLRCGATWGWASYLDPARG